MNIEQTLLLLRHFQVAGRFTFIELEPPNERMFTNEGVMAKRLNRASSQVDSWRIFIERNRDTVLRDLARYAKDKDLIRGPSESEPTCHVGWPLYHPKSWLHIHYDIVIGKRSNLSPRDIEAKSAFKENHNTELMTYDRFIDAAERFYNNQINQNEPNKALEGPRENACHESCLRRLRAKHPRPSDLAFVRFGM